MIQISKSDRERMSEIIQGMFLNMNAIVAWSANNGADRLIEKVKIQNVDNETETLVFHSSSNSNLKFINGIVFFFSEEQKMIFKATITEVAEQVMTVNQPEMIMLLEDEDTQKYKKLIENFIADLNAGEPDPFASFSLDDDEEETALPAGEKEARDWFKEVMSERDASLFEQELSHITLEEEDEMYEGVRTSPRAKPPEGKTLTVQIQDESRPQATYSLYDLSRGGLSFLVFAKDEFAEGESVHIKAFDVNKFDAPMEAVIKVIREADEMGIQYKVGCEFVDAK